MIRHRINLIFIALLAIVINFFPFVQTDTPLYENLVAVLVYHHIDDRSPGPVTISSSLLKAQLMSLIRSGYHFISLQQFKDYMNGSSQIPANAILISFDDGYESFYTKAYPILHALHIPAVNFVVTTYLDRPESSSIPSLSREEILHMKSEDPTMDFQCHSDNFHGGTVDNALLTHKIVVNGILESEEQYETRVLNDTRQCKEKLQTLNSSIIDTYAYPFGSYDSTSVSLLKQDGIVFAFTTNSGLVTVNTDRMQIPRINAGSPYVRAISVNNLIMQTLHKPNKITGTAG